MKASYYLLVVLFGALVSLAGCSPKATTITPEANLTCSVAPPQNITPNK